MKNVDRWFYRNRCDAEDVRKWRNLAIAALSLSALLCGLLIGGCDKRAGRDVSYTLKLDLLRPKAETTTSLPAFARVEESR